MNMLMSIKPCYAEKILSGEKTIEFRKRKFKPVDRIYIYETSPVKMVVGYFKYYDVLVKNPLLIWRDNWQRAGMHFKEFEKYYFNSDHAVAILIECVNIFDKPISINEFDGGVAPQSFRYTDA